jgi:hypothetical protein
MRLQRSRLSEVTLYKYAPLKLPLVEAKHASTPVSLSHCSKSFRTCLYNDQATTRAAQSQRRNPRYLHKARLPRERRIGKLKPYYPKPRSVQYMTCYQLDVPRMTSHGRITISALRRPFILPRDTALPSGFTVIADRSRIYPITILMISMSVH